jgi:hypothetical protein
MHKQKFDRLMVEGFGMARYNVGSYNERKKGHDYCCAIGAVALAAGKDPIDVENSLPIFVSRAIIAASDEAGSKRKAIKAVQAIDWDELHDKYYAEGW